MIDTHAHIHDSAFDTDRDSVVRNALEARVLKMITVGTSVAESVDALATSRKYTSVFATVAVHPHEYSKLPHVETMKKWIREIERLADDPRVVAIGECGLDYHTFGGVPISEAQKEAQKSGFRDHLELARRAGKPIVVHARESYGDVLEMIRVYTTMIPMIILHCYQGNRNMTHRFLDLDERVVFSFAGSVTYPVRKSFSGTENDIRESIKIIPFSRILTETDCPYLAPQAYRATRNEPAYVAEIGKKIADVKNVSFEEIERITEENAIRCFSGLREDVF